MRYSNCSLRLLINIIMRVVLSKTFLKAFSMKFVKILKIWCALPKHRSHQHTLTSQVIITVSSPVSYPPPSEFSRLSPFMCFYLLRKFCRDFLRIQKNNEKILRPLFISRHYFSSFFFILFFGPFL